MSEAALSGLVQLSILFFSLLALWCNSCILLGIVMIHFLQSEVGSSRDCLLRHSNKEDRQQQAAAILLLNAKVLICEERRKCGSPAWSSISVAPVQGISELGHISEVLGECVCRAGRVYTGGIQRVCAFHCLALFSCTSVILSGATGAPRPVFKHHLGPVCSGSIKAGFLEEGGRCWGNMEPWSQ